MAIHRASRPSVTAAPRPARQRVLEAATRLFYGEGIHAVGVDRIVAEAGVTKATFYHHFRGKDELVRTYLEEVHREGRAVVEEEMTRRDDPLEMVLALLDVTGRHLLDPDFRGCPFINAAAEYPDPAHPVRETIASHRAWLHHQLTTLLSAAGHPRPSVVAGMLILLWDGGNVGGCFDDPATVRTAIRSAAQAIITSTQLPLDTRSAPHRRERSVKPRRATRPRPRS